MAAFRDERRRRNRPPCTSRQRIESSLAMRGRTGGTAASRSRLETEESGLGGAWRPETPIFRRLALLALGALCGGFVAFGTPATAQNRLANGDFDVGLAPWDESQVSLIDNDADACPDSDSVGTGLSAGSTVSECFTVAPSEPLRLRFAAGGVGCNASVVVLYFDVCPDSQIGQATHSLFGLGSGWTMADVLVTVPSTPGIQAARLRLQADCDVGFPPTRWTSAIKPRAQLRLRSRYLSPTRAARPFCT